VRYQATRRDETDDNLCRIHLSPELLFRIHAHRESVPIYTAITNLIILKSDPGPEQVNECRCQTFILTAVRNNYQKPAMTLDGQFLHINPGQQRSPPGDINLGLVRRDDFKLFDEGVD
jgi:hypothetical protein